MHKPKHPVWTAVIVAVVLFILLIPTGVLWQLARPVFYKDTVNIYASQYKFDPIFVLALIKTESSFQKSARSNRGAIGLMQLMPDTAFEMAERVGIKVSIDQISEPEVNIQLGVFYLSLLRKEFGEDKVSILAAYNAGPKNVRTWRKGEKHLRIEDIPYKETHAFVKKVLKTNRWLKNLQKIKNLFKF